MGLSWGTGSWYGDYLQFLHSNAQGGICRGCCRSGWGAVHGLGLRTSRHHHHSGGVPSTRLIQACPNSSLLQHMPDSYKPRLIKQNAEKVCISENGRTDGCWKQSFCDLDSSNREEQATTGVAKHELKGDSNPACIAKKPCQLSNLFSLSGSLLIKCPKYQQNPFC